MTSRLPEQTRVGAVHLQVADLTRSVAFYQDVLGLRTVERTAQRAVLAAGGDAAPLVHLQEKRGVLPAARRGANGLFHFALLLPTRESLGRFVTHLTAQGARYGASDHLVSEALYLADPDGLGIEVYADRPRDTWRIANGEIVMTTEPLDLASLAAAGGGQAWSGAPAGTTVGHMHLHVGDLAEARRFYHDALGFDITVSGYPGALFFSAGGYHHHLGTNVWGNGNPASDAHARLLEWHLHVPGAAHAAANSVAAVGYIAERDGDNAVVVDPWGTRLVLRAKVR